MKNYQEIPLRLKIEEDEEVRKFKKEVEEEIERLGMEATI